MGEKKEDFTLCDGRGRGEKNHILEKRLPSKFRGASQWLMACGKEVTSADAPEPKDGAKLCGICAKTKLGKRYLESLSGGRNV